MTRLSTPDVVGLIPRFNGYDPVIGDQIIFPSRTFQFVGNDPRAGDGVTMGGVPMGGDAKTAVPYATPYLRLISDKSLDRITLNDFGADLQPPGAANPVWDTAAYQRAVDYMANYRSSVPVAGGNRIYTGPALNIPRGVYTLTEAMTAHTPDAPRILLRAEGGKDTVTINVPEGVYAIQTTSRLESTVLSGINFIGGKGALRHACTSGNVSQFHLIEDCFFFYYSAAAISSDSIDMPYWIIQRNIFGGRPDAGYGVRGIAIGGLLDSSIIRNNTFLSNHYHIALGPAAGNWQIEHNDFLSIYQNDLTRADLWLRPTDGTGGLFRADACAGAGIRHNKFGVEGFSDANRKAPKILIAQATTEGAGRDTAVPDLTWKTGSDGKNFMGGIEISNNRFATGSPTSGGAVLDGPRCSLMEVYINYLDKITWTDSNYYDGGYWENIVEFKDGSGANRQGTGTRRADYLNTNWNVTIPAGTTLSRYGFSNDILGTIRDYSGNDASPWSVNPFGNPDPTRVVYKSVVGPTGWTVDSTITKAAATDTDGTSEATEFTLSGATETITVAAANPGTANTSRAGYIYGTYKIPTGSPVTSIAFEFGLVGASAPGRSMIKFRLNTVASGRFESFCVTAPIAKGCDSGALYLTPLGGTAGSKITLGKMKFVAGKTPYAPAP